MLGVAVPYDGENQLHPQLRLDELLRQLQEQIASQVAAIVATRDRLHGLLTAVVAIGGDLELPVLLARIVEAGARLADAEYAALGVIGDGALSEFVTSGMSEETRSQIGHLPEGLGLLGMLIKDPVPLRLANLTEHPGSVGFPPGHPPMSSFLGVPLRVRGEIYGNLYLTNKRNAREFSEEDEALIQALASAAGVAIENAYLFDEVRKRESWVAASAAVTTALLSGVQPGEALALIARRARELVAADLATIAIPKADALVVEIADGSEASLVVGRTLEIDHSLAGTAFRSRMSLNVPDATMDERAAGPAPGQTTYGPTLVVPLSAGDNERGVLTMSNSPGGRHFNKDDEILIESFAGQAAIALELAMRRLEADRLHVFEDRDRIARDLHDLVIQRLFASGMRLESLVNTMTENDHIERVRVVVDELDETIREIRSTIYALHASGQNSAPGLRKRLIDIADAAEDSLGFAPSIRFDGPLDTAVPAEIAEELVAVLVESLSNAARHSGAQHVAATVSVTPDAVMMCVADNGVGIPEDEKRRSGLDNLEQRAKRLGGSLDLQTSAGGGLQLVWTVPMPSSPK